MSTPQDTPATLPPAPADAPERLPDLLRCPAPREGDAVVHLDHGLCRLGPARRLELSTGAVHTLELGFRDGDTLHVPVADAVRIWSYGAELPNEALDPLGTDDWAVGQIGRVRELGASLRDILARKRDRAASPVGPVAVSGARLDRAGAGFPHPLTDDQSLALADIASDLRSPTAMNRVLVGDVGCGKTEVAVRAGLACALAGAPVRLVAPTRVLARQHFEDLRARADDLGLAVALYSGDSTEAEKRAVQDGVAAGEIKVVVGTHGLLGEAFAGVDWGLTVLDEEQKFGAKLKACAQGRGAEACAPGNFLRLSATPIPKTIAEARIGLACVSLIHSYPAGRGETLTHRVADTDAALRREITRELDRDGQVIVLCPRIADIKPARKRLRSLLPDATAATVHGGRKSRRNRKALAKFARGDADLLFATSMLETGLNVPGANAMLVMGPERFGLAQLHQLRGRVGRGERDARFGLVVGGEVTPEFEARLATLEELDSRGDGLRLALADSLARGSGRVDDDDQSGHASAIGLELFEHLVGCAADDPDADVRDLLGSVPSVSGDHDWDLGDDALAAAFAQTRAALDRGADCLDGCGDLATVVSACAVLGAVRVAVGEDLWVFTHADGAKTEVRGGMDALAAHLRDHLDRGRRKRAA